MDKPTVSIITPSIRPKGLEITQECLKNQTYKDFEWIVEIGLGNKHDFNQAMNKMIRRVKGDIIIILQDYIKVEIDFVEKCVNACDTNTLFTCPVGKTNQTDYSGTPKWDWRNNEHSQMDWRMWEIDAGFCHKDILYAVGGFDERLDQWWSMDNVSVGKRADILGYKFECLRDNKCIAYDHDVFIEHPFRKDYKPVMVNMIMEEYTNQPTLDYLLSK
jgi:hypothetical protein